MSCMLCVWGLVLPRIPSTLSSWQDVGIWFIFHRVPTGLSEGWYPEGQAELTPLGIFQNNRVHSNFKVSHTPSLSGPFTIYLPSI